jgi:hypothetical protein
MTMIMLSKIYNCIFSIDDSNVSAVRTLLHHQPLVNFRHMSTVHPWTLPFVNIRSMSSNILLHLALHNSMASFTCIVGCAPKWVLNLFTSITTMLKFGVSFCLVCIKQCHVNVVNNTYLEIINYDGYWVYMRASCLNNTLH